MMSDEGPTAVFDEAHVIGRWRLAARPESSSVVARRIPWATDLRGWADRSRSEAAAQAKTGGISPRQDHRYYFHGHDAPKA
jgi:hypothetical protein